MQENGTLGSFLDVATHSPSPEPDCSRGSPPHGSWRPCDLPLPSLHTGWAAHMTKGAAAGTRPPHSRGSAGHMSHAKRLRSGGTPPAGASEHQSPRGADSDLSSSSSRISSKLISANPNTTAAATPRGGWVPRPAREPDPGASHSTVADSGRTPSDAGRHPKREKFKMCVFLTACLSLKERHVVSPCLEHSP